MEGSRSGSGKKVGEGLPPSASRRSSRRGYRENPNQENPEMFVEANLQPQAQPQPQPQQAQGGGEMEPADLRARLANRRYSETFRHRRQNHVRQLEAQATSLEAQIAQNNMEYQRQTTERLQIQNDVEALMRRREDTATNFQAKKVETERVKAKIERLEEEIEAEDEEILNIMKTDPCFHFFYDTFTTIIDTTTPTFLGNPPPHNPAPGDDEVGPSRANDSSSDDST